MEYSRNEEHRLRMSLYASLLALKALSKRCDAGDRQEYEDMIEDCEQLSNALGERGFTSSITRGE